MYCTACGTRVSEDASFCSRCGTAVEVHPQLDRARVESCAAEIAKAVDSKTGWDDAFTVKLAFSYTGDEVQAATDLYRQRLRQS